MLQSNIPNFATKEFPKDEESYNAKILARAGFINKLMSGVYSYLPLGYKVLKNIENIVRKHMDKVGAELLMPVLHPKENWEKTGRWDSLTVLFKTISNDRKEYALGPTHEEIIVPIGQRAISSYKDMPFALYQIQTKFRDEPRAKSGLLRGREFLMKDLYSFHTNPEDLKEYYEKMKDIYAEVFSEIGLETKIVEASGGSFSKFSHEFQVPLENGEDTVVVCDSCSFAQNTEINNSEEGDKCPECDKGKLNKIKASEVGNIFELNTKYSEPFSLEYKDSNGENKTVYMGCYGIGISRLMGVVAEASHDDNGLIWPSSIAPFDVHLLALSVDDEDENNSIYKKAEETQKELEELGLEVLFDDRKDVSNGEKLTESDLIGIPVRLVISKKTGDEIEFKLRNEKDTKMVDVDYIKKYFNK